MRVVDRSTHLDAPPDKVWDAVKQPSTFEEVTRGLMGFSLLAGELPEHFEPGETFELRMKMVGVLPLGRHTIHVESVDDTTRTIQTRERSALIDRWDHRITVEPDGNGTLYRDYVEIEAGPKTAAVWAFAQGLYRYRHRRWKGLARTL